ncbi:MAG: hypothetical protein IPQ07_29135 [Myxococcales bacterium]|jgi:hypothetical protein|nr:hypothetical protein [Myxococcales bacterium]
MRTRLYDGVYEVFVSTGMGIHVGPKFRLLDDARRYVELHAHEASHAVRGPHGDWELVEPRRA